MGHTPSRGARLWPAPCSRAPCAEPLCLVAPAHAPPAAAASAAPQHRTIFCGFPSPLPLAARCMPCWEAPSSTDPPRRPCFSPSSSRRALDCVPAVPATGLPLRVWVMAPCRRRCGSRYLLACRPAAESCTSPAQLAQAASKPRARLSSAVGAPHAVARRLGNAGHSRPQPVFC